jgi:hypothetical protein
MSREYGYSPRGRGPRPMVPPPSAPPGPASANPIPPHVLITLSPSTSGSPLKFMAPGHFCPDVCGIEDFGEADYLRGRVVRAFFRLMQFWPHPTSRTRRRRHAHE